jgi:hypothetical protein
MAWLQSKSGAEAMTVSSDGRALWWDTRRLGEPTEELKLAERGSEAACGAVCLDYSPAAGPTKCALVHKSMTVYKMKCPRPACLRSRSIRAQRGPHACMLSAHAAVTAMLTRHSLLLYSKATWSVIGTS